MNKVPELNKLTDEYILNNEKRLIFQSLFYKLKNYKNKEANFDLQKEEGQIASHFFEYIDSEDLLSLPVPVLYRILNNPQLNINSMNQTNQTQFIEFLFKCLDSYKREASVLFLNIDVANERIDLLSRLLYKYKDVFDFNMINPKFLMETSSQLLSELQKLRMEYSAKLNEIQTEFQKQKQIMESFIPSEFQAMKNRVEELELKLSEQSKFIEKVKNIKVTNITIDSQPKFLKKNEEIKLTAHVEPLNASSITLGNSGAGGGGGFYGGGGGGNTGPGGGGSGFINIAELKDASMFGFNVQPSSSKFSKTESVSNKSPEPLKENAKQGNGFAKITQIG